MDKRWCQAGKNHIWLRQDNQVQLCCTLAHSPDKHMIQLEKTADFYNLINSKKWKKGYRSLAKGPLPDGECRICIDVDNSATGKSSKSQRFKLNNETQNGRKFFLKIDFSNKCNLKCTMCSSARSTSWIKDEQKINQLVSDPVLKVPVFPYNTLDDNWWQEIPLEWWQNLGAVELSGGEPLYQPEALGFLDFLAENVPECRVRIITNTTLIDNDIIKMLNNFKEIVFVCSVDAWDDKIYRYVRGDHYGIDQVKENITKLYNLVKNKDKSRIGICDTIHVVNYDQQSAGQEWLDQFDSRLVKYAPNIVYKPHHLDPRRVLPQNLYANSRPEKDLQKRFYEFITALDKVRNTNVLDIRPEFTKWFREMESANGV